MMNDLINYSIIKNILTGLLQIYATWNPTKWESLEDGKFISNRNHVIQLVHIQMNHSRIHRI